MNQFTKKKHFVGVDISKEHLDLALIGKHNLSVFSDKKVENNLKELREELRKILDGSKLTRSAMIESLDLPRSTTSHDLADNLHVSGFQGEI